MSFIEEAEKFLAGQEILSNHPNRPMMVDTVAYLLDNARGYSSRVPTSGIIDHLKDRGHDISREGWQVRVLGPLRDNGIFIGSKKGGKGGIFLIETKEDAMIVSESYGSRVRKEMVRLNILEKQMKNLGWLE